MFQSIKFAHRNGNRYCYFLKDSELANGSNTLICQTVSSFKSLPLFGGTVKVGTPAVAAAIREYKTRNLPVVKNISLLYLGFRNAQIDLVYDLEKDRQWIDKFAPDLEYGKLYYHCVVNQIKRSLYRYGKRIE